MADYFTAAPGTASDATMTTNGGPVQATGNNGDAAMEDEIEVGRDTTLSAQETQRLTTSQ